MIHITPELKILAFSVLGSIALPIDMLTRFSIPILSAFVWWLIKPHLDNLRKRIKERKLKK